MAYIKKIWKDYPDATTQIKAEDLNNIENGIETLDTSFSGLLNFFYPVGTIYETTSTNLDTTTKMANHFGGTWEVYGAGRVLVAKSADTEFDTIGETGGAKTHTLTEAQIPAHKHRNSSYVVGYNAPGYSYWEKDVSTGGGGDLVYLASADTNNTGGGLAHNNLQPYIVVYRYRRIS